MSSHATPERKESTVTSLRNWNPSRSEYPVPHLSAGRTLVPQRYVVGWPDGIVKVGSTSAGKTRWGPFLARGAVMIDLAFYEQMLEQLEAEAWLRERIAARYPTAFNSRSEASEYLGNQGAGYLKCFRVPTVEWPALARLSGRLT
jgi:hypothetical protein